MDGNFTKSSKMDGDFTESTTFLQDVTTTAAKNKMASYISISIVAGVILLIVLAIWIVWRNCCKSPREKHGKEKFEDLNENTANGTKPKKQYYDQFNVNDNQLTVNSVTAIKWDESEVKKSKNSGIDSISSGSKDIRKITTKNRVFSVSKVSDGSIKSLVIKVPKNLNDVAQSLQSLDSKNPKNYTLAVVDKRSNTIHNIDLRNYKLRKTIPVSPLARAPDDLNKAKAQRRLSVDFKVVNFKEVTDSGHSLDNPQQQSRLRQSVSADEIPFTSTTAANVESVDNERNSLNQQKAEEIKSDEEAEEQPLLS